MTDFNWITCERTGRWAAALRVGAARHGPISGRQPGICEVRSQQELIERLEMRPQSLAFLEILPSNLGKLLPWLADNSRKFPRANFIALLDGTFGVAASPHSNRLQAVTHDIADVFLEAGAAEIADSPRRLQHIFALAERHAAIVGGSQSQADRAQSIADWAWSQLPWHADRE
jgi:hypothetical protein